MGIRVITPKSAISPKNRPQQQPDERIAEDLPARQAPPPPGMGKIVDKTA